MGPIIQFLLEVVRPLSPPIILCCLVAGLLFGGLYQHRLALPNTIIYHILMAGWSFMSVFFLFRLASAILTSTAAPAFAGWIGVGIMWGLYCLGIFLGNKVAKKISKFF
jgi:hypothetical protein